MRQFAQLVLMAASAALSLNIVSGCATPPAARVGLGTVESVTQVDRDAARMGNTPGLSGVAGGLATSPSAGHSSSPGAPVGGATGDTAGPRVAAAQRSAYEVSVKMDDGSRQRITQDAVGFRAGDRVRVTGDGRLAAP